jgi:hypothetical protein
MSTAASKLLVLHIILGSATLVRQATKEPKFRELAYYAEWSHLSDLADLERAYLQQWQEEYPQADPWTVYDISRNATSQCFAILADAAHTGHHSGKYVAPVVENVRGYF